MSDPAKVSKITTTDGVAHEINAATVNEHTVAADVPSTAVFTDEKVTQTESTTDAKYEVTFAGSTGTTTTTKGVGKSQYFTYNPSKKAFTFGNRGSRDTVGNYSIAEGYNVAASGKYSHAEGWSTTASGNYSHAEGEATTASGYCSHAEGDTTTANHKSQHVFGENNIADPSTAAATERGNYIEIVGNGQNPLPTFRSNARTLDWDGNEWLANGLTVGTADTVEERSFKYSQDQARLTLAGGVKNQEVRMPSILLKTNASAISTTEQIQITSEDIEATPTWDGTNTALRGAISSLNSRINSNGIAPGVNIITYTGSSIYTIPYDGYIYLKAMYGTSSYIQADLYGTAGNTAAGFIIGANGNSAANGYFSIFVHKGMKISNVRYSGNASNHEAYFFSIQ